MGGGSYMNGRWFLYEHTFFDTQEVVLISMGGGSYMRTKPLIGAASLHKNQG